MREELLLLQKLIKEICPALYRHLQALDALHLFFCFRWILVCFKREFSMDAVQRVWESVWASEWRGAGSTPSSQRPFCRRFELFVALAILESHEDVIIKYLKSFDEVLQYTHSLSGQLDEHIILRRAEALVYRLRARITRANPPLDPALAALVQMDHTLQ